MYTADFETTTSEPARVWAWAVHGVGTKFYRCGTDIDSFMDFCAKLGGEYWFHNLKFDGNFITYWLLTHNYVWTDEKKLLPGQFGTIIANTGEWYLLRVNINGTKITYYDSLKIIPMPIRDMPKAFGLDAEKLDLDYDGPREPGHQLTPEEAAYLHNDVYIPARAIEIMRGQGMTKITIGSNAFADLKKSVNSFSKIFPALDLQTDKLIRRAYKGGFTWANPRFRARDLGEGIVLDVNSLYPSVMRDEIYPVHDPVYQEGEITPSARYPLYIQRLECGFRLKPGRIPCIQLKQSFRFAANEWLESSDGKIVTLCVTNVDLELIRQQYDLYAVTYLDGWKFRAYPGIFAPYVDKWTAVKIRATEEGNRGLRTIAKLMLNSCYGKLATNPKRLQKVPMWDEEHGRVAYVVQEAEDAKPAYVPAAIFVTSYARRKTILAAQACYDRVAYCDTDSLHLVGTELPEGIDVDPVRLGAWKLESHFDRARFLRQKCYIEESDGQLHVTVAGMPAACHDQVTWDNFWPGLQVRGKLIPHVVPGGVILAETTYTLI